MSPTTSPPCKQAHGLTPNGWVHTKDGKPCKHMNAAHSTSLAKVQEVNSLLEVCNWTKERL